MDAKNARVQFVRERVTPILKEAGFRASGQTFRYLRDDGHQAVFWVRGYPMGGHVLEFYVDENLLVRDWIAFIDWCQKQSGSRRPLPPFEKADMASGPVHGRLGRPGGGDAVVGGVWGFDPHDEEVVERFVSLLRADASTYVALCDPAAFESQVRNGYPDLPATTRPPAPVLLTLLLVGQGRFSEARESLAETRPWFKHDELAAWVGTRSSGRG